MLTIEKFKQSLSVIGTSKNMPVVLSDDTDVPLEIEATNVTGIVINMFRFIVLS